MKTIADYQREPVNYAYLGNNKALALTYFGSRILLDTRNIQHMRIISHGCYEPAVAWAIEENLSFGGRMIDIGTNLGYFTLLGCQLVGHEGHVIGFEANPDIYEMMSSSVFANAFRKRCKTYNNAVFNQAKEFEFTWDSAGHGGGRVINDDSKNRDENIINVSAVKLDDFLPGPDRTFNVMKIDTEGSDPFVIEGAQNLIKENPGAVVITEWSPRFMEARGYSTKKAIDLIFSLFSEVKIIKKIGVSELVSKDDLANAHHGNLLLRV